MKCPIDGELLVMATREGVEIDYCPKCRGVWLDRGELDKIIERSAATPEPAPAPRYDDRDYRRDDDDYKYRKSYKKKRKESFLSELFDF